MKTLTMVNNGEIRVGVVFDLELNCFISKFIQQLKQAMNKDFVAIRTRFCLPTKLLNDLFIFKISTRSSHACMMQYICESHSSRSQFAHPQFSLVHNANNHILTIVTIRIACFTYQVLITTCGEAKQFFLEIIDTYDSQFDVFRHLMRHRNHICTLRTRETRKPFP